MIFICLDLFHIFITAFNLNTSITIEQSVFYVFFRGKGRRTFSLHTYFIKEGKTNASIRGENEAILHKTNIISVLMKLLI